MQSPANFYASFLRSLAPLQWPDLSSHRLPHNRRASATAPLPSFHTAPNARAIAVVALARLIGYYSDASQILVGVLHDSHHFHLVLVDALQDSSWEQLVASAVASLSHHHDQPPLSLALFKSVLGFSSSQIPCLPICSFQGESSDIDPEFPLVLSFNAGAKTQFSSSARADCMHPSVLSVFNDQFQAFFGHALGSPSTPSSSIPPLPQHLTSANERDIYMLPPVVLITDYIKLKATSAPNHPAVRWYPELSPDNQDCEQLTYEQLHRQSNSFARWLLSQGLQPDDRVAISMNRNLAFHVAMIGIMKAGGCYVPIDPELPYERKSYIVIDSNARFVITTSDLPELATAKHVIIDDPLTSEEITACSDQDVRCARPEGLSYLLYTSGTTGNPKGCLLTHDGLSNAAWSLAELASDVKDMQDLAQGRYLAIASIAFDVHLAETFVSFILGMTLVTAPRSLIFQDLPIFVNALGISHLGIVPSLIEATMTAAEELGDTTTLRYIASGGEKMSDAILDRWADHPIVRLANFYGPSEVTIGCCARVMHKSTPRANIGPPFRNVSAYVVDPEMRVLPRGAVGELVVEGPLVGKGYHGRPDLAQKVFLPWRLKFHQHDGCAYRTGDLVRMMPNGSLEISGRIDTQIKLRGVRIEAEGVSSIVRKASSSLDACTILVKHPSIGVDQLVTFLSGSNIPISTRKSVPPRIETMDHELLATVRSICERELASYMRPSHFVRLSWLPLSSNGKSNEKMLGEIFRSMDLHRLGGHSEGRSEPQVSEVERRVLEIIARHTRVDIRNFGGQTSLFECGIDSISVIRFANDLNSTFGSVVKAADIMKSPKVSDIAGMLERHDSPPEKSSICKVFSEKWERTALSAHPGKEVSMVLPTYPIQPGVLFRSSGSSSLYVQHVALDCGSSLTGQMREAWEKVMNKHAILRTIFHFDTAIAQVVLSPQSCNIPWTEHECESLSDSDFLRWFMDNEGNAITHDINLQVSSIIPYRVNCYKSPPNTKVVLSIHHSLFDGISLPKVLSAAEKEYLGVQSPMDAPVTDILDRLYDIDEERAKEFWERYMQGYSWPAALRRRPSSGNGCRVAVSFERSLSSLKSKASNRQVTMQAVLTCAYGSLISKRLYHQNDVIFGTIRSGRLLHPEGVDDALCPLITILPVRVNFSSKNDTLQNLQRDIGDMLKYENVTLGRIQNWVRPGVDLFDTLFSVSLRESESLQEWRIIESEPPKPDYFLSVEVVLDTAMDSLVVQAAWEEDNIPTEFVRKLLGDFETTVVDVLEAGGSQIPTAIAHPPIPSHNGNAHPVLDDAPPHASEEEIHVDPVILNHIRGAVSQYLAVNDSLLKDDTNFIAIGMDSIKAIGLSRVLNKLDELSGVNFTLSPVDVMRHFTVRRLASFILKQKPSVDADVEMTEMCDRIDAARRYLAEDNLKLTPDDEVELYPTTALQAGMLSQTLSSGGDLYLHMFPLQLSAKVDRCQLRRAWDGLVDTLSILRTSFHFVVETGRWMQVVHSEYPQTWSSEDFLAEHDYQTQLQRFHSSVILPDEVSFHRPPVHARLFINCSSDATLPSYFVISLHHALYDGISIDMMMRLLSELYHSQSVPAPTQFTDILRHVLYQERLGAAYWTRKLKERWLPDAVMLQGGAETHTLSYRLSLSSEEVEQACRQSAVTPQCICQAATTKLIASMTQSPSVIFGHVVSGRGIDGAEEVIGPVLNTIPCISRIDPIMSNSDFLGSIQHENTEALPWQQASLRDIQRELGVSRLWDVLFVFQPVADVDEHANTNKDALWQFSLDGMEEEALIQYPFNLEFHQQEFGFLVKAACRSDFLSIEELKARLRCLDEYLCYMVRNPTDSVSHDLPALTEESEHDGQDSPPNGSSHRSDGEPVPAPIRQLLSSVTKVPVDHISMQTSLTSIGIDSISAIQVASKCRSLGMSLTVKAIASCHTIGDLVRGGVGNTSTSSSVSTRQRNVEVPEEEKQAIMTHLNLQDPGSVELISSTSPGMKWLLAAWQLSQGTRFQHSFAWRLPSDIDVPRLRLAWSTLLCRHAILRSTFCLAPGYTEPRIVIYKAASLESCWSEESVSGDDVRPEIVRIMKAQVESPPPMGACQTRAVLVTSPGSHHFVLRMHHAQYDAWSLVVLLNDISSLYLQEQPASSSDLLSFLGSVMFDDDELREQQQYWQTTIPSNIQPTYFPRLTSHSTIRPQQRIVYTDHNAFTRRANLEHKARLQQSSLQAVILACWAKLQAQYSSSTSVVFGLWSSGRSGPMDGMERLAVPCMNVLPMHVENANDKPPTDLAALIQADLRKRTSLIEHSELSNIDKWVKGDGRPLCNVNINVVKIGTDIGTRSEFESLDVPYFVPELRDIRHSEGLENLAVSSLIKDDLMIDIVIPQTQDTVVISVEASADLISMEQAVELVETWKELVETALESSSPSAQ